MNDNTSSYAKEIDDLEQALNPGEVLQRARESKGLSIEDMAEKLCLRQKNILDIENNVISEQSSATFAKGYVRLYAKHLDLNIDEMLSLFDSYHGLKQEPAKLQSFSRRVAREANDDRWMMVTYIIIIILIAGAVLWWFQQSNPKFDFFENSNTTTEQAAEPRQPQESQTSNNVSPQDAVANTIELSSSLETNEEEYSQVANTLPESDNGEPIEEPIEVSETEQPTELVESPVENNLNEEDSGQTEIASELIFTFTNDCWVNIEDAAGENIAYGVKKAGRVMPVSGVPPFQITLGAPQFVTLTLDGENVDMSSFPSGRTARFTLPFTDM